MTKDDSQLRKDAEELRTALSALIRAYEFRDRDRICCHDVSVRQSHALETLADRGALTLNELAGALYLDKSTTSRVVDALERKGYAERGNNPDSARSILVSATPRGLDLHQRIQEDLLAQEMNLLRAVDPDIRTQTTELVARLAAAATARIEVSGGTCLNVA